MTFGAGGAPHCVWPNVRREEDGIMKKNVPAVAALVLYGALMIMMAEAGSAVWRFLSGLAAFACLVYVVRALHRPPGRNEHGASG